MELTAVAVAVGFAALSPQCVERAGEERSSSQALFQELRELMGSLLGTGKIAR